MPMAAEALGRRARFSAAGLASEIPQLADTGDEWIESRTSR